MLQFERRTGVSPDLHRQQRHVLWVWHFHHPECVGCCLYHLLRAGQPRTGHAGSIRIRPGPRKLLHDAQERPVDRLISASDTLFHDFFKRPSEEGLLSFLSSSSPGEWKESLFHSLKIPLSDDLTDASANFPVSLMMFCVLPFFQNASINPSFSSTLPECRCTPFAFPFNQTRQSSAQNMLIPE